jgi:hypothetical protein
MNGPCKKCYKKETAANRAQEKTKKPEVVSEKTDDNTMEAGCSSAPELFLDGFCLTDKRGKWYKATFCDTSTQPTYRTY